MSPETKTNKQTNKKKKKATTWEGPSACEMCFFLLLYSLYANAENTFVWMVALICSTMPSCSAVQLASHHACTDELRLKAFALALTDNWLVVCVAFCDPKKLVKFYCSRRWGTIILKSTLCKSPIIVTPFQLTFYPKTLTIMLSLVDKHFIKCDTFFQQMINVNTTFLSRYMFFFFFVKKWMSNVLKAVTKRPTPFYVSQKQSLLFMYKIQHYILPPGFCLVKSWSFRPS